MHKTDKFEFIQISAGHILTACLALTGVMTMCVMVLGRGVHPPLWHLMVVMLNVLGVLSFGVSIREPMSRTARNLMLLGLGFCGWYLFLLLTDFRHFSTVSYYGPRFVYQTCFAEYLFLLPYAALRDEKDKATGIKILGTCYAISTVFLTVLTVLLCLGIVPDGLHSVLMWELYNLAIGWEPNVLASIFMLGILMKGIFLYLELKPWVKVLLCISMAVEMCALGLTATKAVFVLTAGVLGGLVFFRVYRGHFKKPDWKKLIAGLLAGAAMAGAVLILIVTADKINVAIFDSPINKRQHIVDYALEEQAKLDEERSKDLQERTAERKRAPLPENPVLRKLDQLTWLGGRREIWTMTVREIIKQPSVLLFGTREVPRFINAHGIGMERLGYKPAHPHNAWLETLLETGLVGFLFACWFTWLALKNGCLLLFRKKSSLFQKGIALLVFAILGAEFMEPYLFFVGYPNNFANIFFVLCLGYLVYWAKNAEDADI